MAAEYADLVADRDSNSLVVIAAAAAHSLLRLQQKRGGPSTVTWAPVDSSNGPSMAPSTATPEQAAIRHCLDVLIGVLLFNSEVPAEVVIEAPTQWPPKFGRDALLLTRRSDGTIIAEAGTFTASEDHALVQVSRDRAAVVPGDHPLSDVTRGEAEDRVPFQKVDAAIARLRALARAR